MPRPRKSQAQKALEGTAQKHRHHDEPEFEAVDGGQEPPDWMINKRAIKDWHRYVKILSDVKVLSQADLDSLAHYVNLNARIQEIWIDGDTPTAAALSERRRSAQEFGLTPASRSRAVAIGDGADKNPFAELMAS